MVPIVALLLITLQTPEPAPLYPHLAADINAMAKADQAIRFKLVDEMRDGKKPSMDTMRRMKEVDHRDTDRMKWIVQEFGWPTPAMVGSEACGNAWLLVQHADDDRPFQKRCLALIEPLARTGVIEGRYYAYLFDRVQVGDGKLQRFGTQGRDADGVMVIDPVENPAKVDALRKRYGLEPLETYAKQLADMYHDKLAPDWRARLAPPKKPGR